MNKYTETFDKQEARLQSEAFRKEDRFQTYYTEFVLGKIKNPEENAEKIEDALYEVTKYQAGEDFT